MKAANLELIENFYRAFQAGDAETMAASYHPEATFQDPVFSLEGPPIGDMWRMFCVPGNDVKIEFSNAVAGDTSGSAHWEAFYTFRPTGNRVHNKIDASFKFENGLISGHVDEFSFPTWAKQALGVSGAVFGRTTWLRRKVQSQASAQLARFSAKRT